MQFDSRDRNLKFPVDFREFIARVDLFEGIFASFKLPVDLCDLVLASLKSVSVDILKMIVASLKFSA